MAQPDPPTAICAASDLMAMAALSALYSIGIRVPEQVAVISSEYHLYRASLLAEQAGIHMIGVPAKTTLPVLRINYFLREAAAVGRLWVFGY